MSEEKYSFSRLESFHNCKRSYYNTYVLKNRGGDNIYSYLGTVCHELTQGIIEGKETNMGALEKMTVYNQDGEIIDLSEYNSLVFTVKGQHDSNADGYTFFNMLIDNKVIINPRTLIIEGLQYNFINYNKRADSFIEARRPETKVMINSYHFPILERGILADGFASRTLSPSDHGIFKDVDLAIINDIHKSIDPYSIETDGTQTLVITPGSVGRTSLDEGQDRDTANLIQIEIDFTDDYGLNAELVEMELKPSDEFFNKGFVVQKKIRENAFENFRVELSTVEIDYFNPVEDIQALEDVPDDVKEVAAGYECGVTVDNFRDLKEGDILEAFTMEQIKPKG